MFKKVAFTVLSCCVLVMANTDARLFNENDQEGWIVVTSNSFVIGTAETNFNIRFFGDNGSPADFSYRGYLCRNAGQGYPSCMEQNPDISATSYKLYGELSASNPGFNHILAAALAAQNKGQITVVLRLKENATGADGEVSWEIVAIDNAM